MIAARNIEPTAIQNFLDKIIQVDHPQADRPSFKEVFDEIGQLGLHSGRPVMVAIPNGLPFVTIVFALLAHGAVPVLLPFSAPPSRVLRIGQVIGADALIASSVPPDLQKDGTAQPISELAKFTVINNANTRRYQPGEIVLLTSGTSGIFSGCLFSIESLLLNATRHAQSIGQTGNDTLLINLPMYYSFAFVAQLLSTFALGGKAVIMGPPFTPAHYEQTINDYQVSLSSLTPVMVHAWLQSGSGKFPASLRALTVGGDALEASNVARILAMNPGLELYLTYGLTQAGPRVSTLAAHLEKPERYTSVGLPLPGVQAHLNKENPNNKAGELIVDTDTGMLQRISGSHLSAKAVAGSRRSIHTGDMFGMDDDGYLFFRGRRPSFVINHGEKIYLKSVCEIAEGIPGIVKAEAWIQGSADDNSGFILDIYCEEDSSLSEKEIRRELGRVLMRAEQPSRLLLHPASCIGWRKTATQKIYEP